MKPLSSKKELVEMLLDLKFFIEQSRDEYDQTLVEAERETLYNSLGDLKFNRDKHISILEETIKRLGGAKVSDKNEEEVDETVEEESEKATEEVINEESLDDSKS